MSSTDKARLDNMQDNSINQTTADGRYLQLTGGVLSSDLTISNTSNARLIINADTDNDAVEDGQPTVVLTQDGGITGAEIKLVQGGSQDSALVLAPFIDYNTVTPVKNYNVFVHDKKVWHEGNFLKSEFTPASHIGTGGTSHAAVTTSTNGFMIASDKTKLDGVSTGANKTATSTTNGNILIDGAQANVYTHPTTDGNIHLPAGGASGQWVKWSAAGTGAWTSISWADVGSKPTSTVANIDDAVTKRHTQNTDTGTTSGTFTVGSSTDASTTALGVFFGNNSALYPYIRWSSSEFQVFKDWNSGTNDVWADLKANTFKNSAGTEVSYVGHTHAFSSLTGIPATFAPPIATSAVLGGVKQGTNLSIAADGTISGAYATATTSTDGLLSSTDKAKLDTIQGSAINQTTADGRYLQLTGGSLTGTLNAKAVYATVESRFSSGTWVDPHSGFNYGLKVSQGIATDKLRVTGDIDVTGNVDGVDVSGFKGSFDTHVGSNGASHAAVTTATNGFMLATDKVKLDGVQTGAINQTSADNRYVRLSGGSKIAGDLTVNGTLYMGATNESTTTVTFDGITAASLKISNDQGSIQLTPISPKWAHISTDMNNFVFTKGIYVMGGSVSSYTGDDLSLKRDGITKLVMNATDAIFTDEVTAPTFYRNSDGVEVSYADHRHANATSSADGFMSMGDKSKLDTVAANANHITGSATNGNILVDGGELNVYIHPTTDGNLHVPATGTTNNGKFLKAGISAGSISWTGINFTDVSGTVTDTQHGSRGGGSLHSVATTSAHGFMSSTDKTKLDAIEASAISQTTADGRYLQLTGGTLSGSVTSTNAMTFISKLSGYKSFVLHHPSGDNFIIAPSATVNGTDWDWTKQIVFSSTGGMTLKDTLTGTNGTFSGTISEGGTSLASKYAPIAHVGSSGTAHAAVTTSVNGFMISTDKTKLDGISAGANKTLNHANNGSISIDGVEAVVYTHPSTDGNLHVPATGTTNNGKFLKAGATAGSLSWGGVAFTDVTGTITDTQHGSRGGGNLHALVTTTVDGFMSASDKVRLNGIQDNAINQTTADGRYLQIGTGGSINGSITVTSVGDSVVTINADTDNDGAEIGEAKIVLTQDGGIIGTEIKLEQSANNFVLAPFVDYNTATPTKNYNVFVHDKKVWHEGNFLKSEFTPASHIGTNGSSHAAVTTTVNGFMLATDKVKLDGVSTGANKTLNHANNGSISIDGTEAVVYTHPSGDGNLHVPATSTTNNGKFLKAGSTAGNISWTQVAFTDVSGSITATQHGAQTDATLHAVATTSANGFMSSSDKSKLDGIQSSAINQTTADARYVLKTGDTVSGNTTFQSLGSVTLTLRADTDNVTETDVPTLKFLQDGDGVGANIGLDASNQFYIQPSTTASGVETIYYKNIAGTMYGVWHSGNFNPSSKSDVGHTHTVANITDLATNFYNKTEINTQMAAKGDAFLGRTNSFTDTNTFTKSGVALKIQPATAVAANTVLLQMNNSTGASLVTMGTGGSGETTGQVVINGDLVVTGTTTQSATQDIQGDMNVTGNLNVTGNAILGDGAADQTTIKGDLRLEGNLMPIGKYLEIGRLPVFGIADDFQFETDSLSFADIISSYSTFDTNGGSAFDPVSPGATRYYRLMVSYASSGTDDSTLRIVQEGTTTEVISFALPAVNTPLDTNFGLGNKARTWMSSHFSTGYIGSTTFQGKKNVSGNLAIRYIELIAYDYYA
jgi:hypothetical protein